MTISMKTPRWPRLPTLCVTIEMQLCILEIQICHSMPACLISYQMSIGHDSPKCQELIFAWSKE